MATTLPQWQTLQTLRNSGAAGQFKWRPRHTLAFLEVEERSGWYYNRPLRSPHCNCGFKKKLKVDGNGGADGDGGVESEGGGSQKRNLKVDGNGGTDAQGGADSEFGGLRKKLKVDENGGAEAYDGNSGC